MRRHSEWLLIVMVFIFTTSLVGKGIGFVIGSDRLVEISNIFVVCSIVSPIMVVGIGYVIADYKYKKILKEEETQNQKKDVPPND